MNEKENCYVVRKREGVKKETENQRENKKEGKENQTENIQTENTTQTDDKKDTIQTNNNTTLNSNNNTQDDILNPIQSFYNTLDQQPESIICKFCYQPHPHDFISPCGCKGTIKYVHKTCLKKWRFRKNLKEIKHCEQCFKEYQLDEDVHFNHFYIHLISFVVLSGCVFGFNLFLNVFLESVSFVLEEMLYENGYYYERKQNNYNRDYNRDFNSNYNRDYKQNNYKSIFKDTFLKDTPKGTTLPKDTTHTTNLLKDTLFKEYTSFKKNTFPFFDDLLLNTSFHYLTITQSTIILISLYQIIFSYSFFSTINLFFTLWRVFHFNFKFDYFLLGCIVFYYLKRFYEGVWGYVERVSYFILNK